MQDFQQSSLSPEQVIIIKVIQRIEFLTLQVMDKNQIAYP